MRTKSAKSAVMRPQYRSRVVKMRKGRGSYTRKEKHNEHSHTCCHRSQQRGD